MTSTPGTIGYSIPDQWNGGFIAAISFTPQTSINGWRIEFTFDGDIVNIWNAEIVEHVGNLYVVENVSYNGSLSAGQTIDFGFQGSGSAADLMFSGGEPVDPPEILVGDVSIVEGNPSDGPAPGGLIMGPLSTSGNQILNAAGEAVQIEAVSWFGLETSNYAPHGLWTRNWQEMMDEIKATGFNAIRLPFSLEAVLDGGVSPNGIDFSQNPDLVGLSSLEIMDAIVAYAEEIGIGILLDNHRSAAGNGPNGNGLWYDGGYTEADWLEAWQLLASRYGNSPAIIGADVSNEPHGATWDAFASAAERAGEVILGETSDWLIVVEGVGQYNGESYWWGGNLMGVAERPVELSVGGKVVYSPHDYPASVYDQTWFHDGSDLYEVFREHWGYIHEEEIAPILVGEFGSRLETAIDQAWADAIVAYLRGDYDGDGAIDPGSHEMNFAWWSWNPNSGDTGGILEDDWRTIRQNAVDLLDPLLDGPEGTANPVIRFDVALSEASSHTIEIAYGTVDGTAIAGEDYVAKSGTLTFAPGETLKQVSVTVLPDLIVEGNETFSLSLTGPDGTALAQGTITDDDDGSALPTLTVEDIVVDEGSGTARLTLALSSAAATPVAVEYVTRDGQALAGDDYLAASGTLMIAAGATGASLDIDLVDDAVAEAKETFKVQFASEDASVETAKVRIKIIDDDAAAHDTPFFASDLDAFV